MHLGNYTFQVECLGEDDLEDFLDVDGCGGGAEYERGVHCLCETLGLRWTVRAGTLDDALRKMAHLLGNFLLLFS